MSFTILFQLIFTFIYSTFNKKISITSLSFFPFSFFLWVESDSMLYNRDRPTLGQKGAMAPH